MNYGMLGIIGALALGAGVGAILPVPAHEQHEPAVERLELAVPSSAELDPISPEQAFDRVPADEEAAEVLPRDRHAR